LLRERFREGGKQGGLRGQRPVGIHPDTMSHALSGGRPRTEVSGRHNMNKHSQID
jgi:hypothetical protein